MNTVPVRDDIHSWLHTAKIKLLKLHILLVRRNSGHCNLIGHVDCYGYTCNYNAIIVISISLSYLKDLQRSRTSI